MTTTIRSAIRTQTAWDGMTPEEQAVYAFHFTTVSAWVSAIPSSLVDADEQWIGEAYNDWPEGLDNRFTISGKTTDITRNIVLTSPLGQRHNGLKSSGFFLRSFANYDGVVNIVNNYVTLEYIEVQNSGSSSARGIISANGVVTYSHVLITAGSTGISNIGDNNVLKGCIVVGRPIGFSHLNWQVPEITNCLAIRCGTGFALGGSNSSPILKNNVAFDCTTDYSLGAAPQAASTNNATSASVLDARLGDLTDIVDADFVDAPADNFRIHATSALKDAALNLIEANFLPSPQFDIDSNQRPDTGPWDCGFHHFIDEVPGGSDKLLIGSVSVDSVRVGNDIASKIMVGGSQVWPPVQTH